MIFNTFNEHFYYIGQRNQELIKKHGLNSFDYDPEFIYESGDLKWFVDSLASKLFPEDKYEFIKDYVSKDGNHFIVKFKFCGEEFKIYTRSDDDFIGGNYFDILQKMNKVSKSKTIFTTVLSVGLSISGKRNELEKARQEGLTIALNKETTFWHVNSKGERMKPNEEFYIYVKPLTDEFEVKKISDYMMHGIRNLSGPKSRLSSYSENQINFIINRRNFQIYVDGVMVSSENSERDKELRFDYRPAGKILAYGLLDNLSDDSVEVELKYRENSPKNRLVKRTELLNLIEEYVK